MNPTDLGGTFRKKPVVIEAHKWTGSGGSHGFLREWTNGYVNLVTGGMLQVMTNDGPIYASVGDWIIKGVAGEFYPCKPEIFEATYEKVRPTETGENDGN